MLYVKWYLIGAVISGLITLVFVLTAKPGRDKWFYIKGIVLYTVMSWIGICFLAYDSYVAIFKRSDNYER